MDLKAFDNRRFLVDLHCDTISECLKQDVGLVNGCLQLSLDRLPERYRLCQVFAVFIPDTLRGEAAKAYFEQVYQVWERQLSLHRENVVELKEFWRLWEALNERQCAAILSVEGGAVLAGELDRVEMLRRRGVRMMTLTWNGENELCGGSGTDIGFSDFGRGAVREMERVGMIVDVSHLSDKGFWELCEFASLPFVASHSNARAVCPHPRNLTDDMFREIVRRRGLVGINYYHNFIRPDGEPGEIADLLRHIHHFLELGGEDVLALGSDFDGADMPPYLQDVSGVVFLEDSMLQSGIGKEQTEKIFYKNAARFFRRA